MPKSKGQERVATLNTQAKVIARAYRAAQKAAAKQAEGSTAPPRTVGKRTTRLNPLAPFDRPESRFTVAVYRLAVDAKLAGVLRDLEGYVRRRDGDGVHRPRNATEVDWVVRLVDRCLRTRPSKDAAFKRIRLLSDSQLSRLGTELNFALQHGIRPDIVCMFIDYIGGWELISANLEKGDYNLESDYEWLAVCKDRALVDHNDRLTWDASDDDGDSDEDSRSNSVPNDAEVVSSKAIVTRSNATDVPKVDDDWND